MKSEKTSRKVDEILIKVSSIEKTDFVTDKFGNKWKEHAIKNYSMNTVLDIAHKQGRIAILLEKEIESLVEQLEEQRTIPNYKEIDKHLEDLLAERYPVFSPEQAENVHCVRATFGFGFQAAIRFVKNFVNQQ